MFLLPVMISSKRTPKLKTSDLVEYSPSMAYSGAMYPLIYQKVKKKYLKIHEKVFSRLKKENGSDLDNFFFSNNQIIK